MGHGDSFTARFDLFLFLFNPARADVPRAPAVACKKRRNRNTTFG
jgi:hypothetical protein